MSATVVAVSSRPIHGFSKTTRDSIVLIKGEGVFGDAHRGVTVKHRSRVKVDPMQPNLRQVHLIGAELLDELRAKGFDIEAGTLGENVLTGGIDLLALPTGARLHLGAGAIVEVTGLRNPCAQLDDYQRGLTRALLDRDDEGNLIRKAGVMGIVLADGEVRPGDGIVVAEPPRPHRKLEKV